MGFCLSFSSIFLDWADSHSLNWLHGDRTQRPGGQTGWTSQTNRQHHSNGAVREARIDQTTSRGRRNQCRPNFKADQLFVCPTLCATACISVFCSLFLKCVVVINFNGSFLLFGILTFYFNGNKKHKVWRSRRLKGMFNICADCTRRRQYVMVCGASASTAFIQLVTGFSFYGAVMRWVEEGYLGS